MTLYFVVMEAVAVIFLILMWILTSLLPAIKFPSEGQVLACVMHFPSERLSVIHYQVAYLMETSNPTNLHSFTCFLVSLPCWGDGKRQQKKLLSLPQVFVARHISRNNLACWTTEKLWWILGFLRFRIEWFILIVIYKIEVLHTQ